MFKKHYKFGFLIIAVGIFIGLFTSIVFAATVSSSWGYYGPFLGYQYRNMSTISNDFYNEYSTQVEVYPYDHAPVGYIGLKAQLYTSAGVLVGSSDWFYNTSELSYIGLKKSAIGLTSGYYYSKGLSSAYNGNGYSVYSTFQSPNLYFSF